MYKFQGKIWNIWILYSTIIRIEKTKTFESCALIINAQIHSTSLTLLKKKKEHALVPNPKRNFYRFHPLENTNVEHSRKRELLNIPRSVVVPEG